VFERKRTKNRTPQRAEKEKEKAYRNHLYRNHLQSADAINSGICHVWQSLHGLAEIVCR
jgi:hypothetical protein